MVWDIENMPLLKEDVMPSSIFAIKFREFLSQSLGVAPHSFMIFACCHLKWGGSPSVSERVIGGLTANGIVVTVMPKAKEGQADQAIKSHIHTFFEMFNTPAEDRVMVLISSDSDFQHDITNASLKGCKVAVVYRPACMGRDHMQLCSGLGDKVRLWDWLDVLSLIAERRVTEADLDVHPPHAQRPVRPHAQRPVMPHAQGPVERPVGRPVVPVDRPVVPVDRPVVPVDRPVERPVGRPVVPVGRPVVPVPVDRSVHVVPVDPYVARMLDIDSIRLDDDDDDDSGSNSTASNEDHSHSLASHSPGPSMVPCRFFAKYGACAKGSSCPFSHILPGAGVGAGI